MTEKRDTLLDLRKQAETQLYKLVIYISGGALIATLTFSEKILSLTDTRSKTATG
ncbi:MAG: hypothetical protein HY738_10030 [Bacteroidia bacterium]|nr:hypothetical protein [Bacteroidia bacterium]